MRGVILKQSKLLKFPCNPQFEALQKYNLIQKDMMFYLFPQIIDFLLSSSPTFSTQEEIDQHKDIINKIKEFLSVMLDNEKKLREVVTPEEPEDS